MSLRPSGPIDTCFITLNGVAAELPSCVGENFEHLSRCCDDLSCGPVPTTRILGYLYREYWTRISSGGWSHVLVVWAFKKNRASCHANLVHSLTPSHSIPIATDRSFRGKAFRESLTEMLFSFAEYPAASGLRNRSGYFGGRLLREASSLNIMNLLAFYRF